MVPQPRDILYQHVINDEFELKNVNEAPEPTNGAQNIARQLQQDHFDAANRCHSIVLMSHNKRLLEFLKFARHEKHVRQLVFHHVFFDDYLISSISRTLNWDERLWVMIEIADCTGAVETVVEMVMTDPRVHYVRLTSESNNPRFVLPLQYPISSSIAKISMDPCKLTPQQMTAMFECLNCNPTLLELSLKRKFLPGVSSVLAWGIQGLTSLEVLSLHGGHLQDHDLAQVLLGLVEHPSLKVLILDQNMCRIQSLNVLYHILSCTNKLKELSLNDQKIEGPGDIMPIEMLGAALLINCSLHDLELRNNLFLEKSFEDFVRYLTYSQKLTKLDISGSQTTGNIKSLVVKYFRSLKLKKILMDAPMGFQFIGDYPHTHTISMFRLDSLTTSDALITMKLNLPSRLSLLINRAEEKMAQDFQVANELSTLIFRYQLPEFVPLCAR